MKKLVFHFVFYSLFIVAFSCNTNQNANTESEGLTEKFIEDTILTLKEVQEKNLMIDSITDHKQGIALLINKPTEQDPEFQIQAGYSAPDQFETYFHFYLNPVTKQISILDITSDKRMSLDEWRNLESESIFLNLGMDLLKSEKISELKIGLSEKNAIALIGKPERMDKITKWGADGLNHQTWNYKNIGISLDICWDKADKQEIFGITITNPCNFKTIRGIGIGSSKQEVKEAYKKEIEPGTEDENNLIAGTVYGGIFFEFENNKVKSIFIGASAE